MNEHNYQLNGNQQYAVEWDEGPLLVLAGPGSGKTLVLTLRAARILKKDPDASVLALTFTTKAADEMRERLDKLLGSGWIEHTCAPFIRLPQISCASMVAM